MVGVVSLGEQVLPPFGWSQAAGRWTFAPVVTAAIAVAAAAYLWGARRVRSRHPARPWPWWRTSLFLAGLAAVVVATESGVGTYDGVLFWDHMIQHLLLIMVAPPLLVAGQPVTLLLHASRNPLHRWAKRAVRSRATGWVTWPALGIAAYAATIVGTHLTGVVSWVMTDEAAHNAEHGLYLLAGYLFFLPIVGREPIRWRLSYPMRLGALVLIMPVDTFTGLILGFANSGIAGAASRSWGPSPVDDVHSAGAAMWIGGDAIMLVTIMIVFMVWARDDSVTGDPGWLEAARRARLATLTGPGPERAAAVPHAPAIPAGARPADGRTAGPVAAGTGTTGTGGAAPAGTAGVRRHGHGNVDDDDEQLAAYNAYLARLNQAETGPGRPRSG